MSNCQTIHTKAKMRKIAFLQANWYKAEQYCRFHGMHLASINSEEEQRNLQEHIQSFGKFLKTSQIEISSFPFLTIRV